MDSVDPRVSYNKLVRALGKQTVRVRGRTENGVIMSSIRPRVTLIYYLVEVISGEWLGV